MVTSNVATLETCRQQLPEKSINMLNPAQDNLLDETSEKYDLIILDRVWDQTQAIADILHKNNARQQVLRLTYKYLRQHGQVVCLADNKMNLKKPWQFINSFIKYIIKDNVSPFSRDYKKQLKKAGYENNKCFFLFPHIADFNRIISTDRRSTQDFTIKSHNLTHKLPKQVTQWPKWLLVKLGIDAWLMTTYLYWGRK